VCVCVCVCWKRGVQYDKGDGGWDGMTQQTDRIRAEMASAMCVVVF
jgi:hypothetical protein